METLISPDTMACLVAFLAFMLYQPASVKVRRDVARALQRRSVAQPREDLAHPGEAIRSCRLDASESGTAATVSDVSDVSEHAREGCPQASMSAHGKERIP